MKKRTKIGIAVITIPVAIYFIAPIIYAFYLLYLIKYDPQGAQDYTNYLAQERVRLVDKWEKEAKAKNQARGVANEK